MTDFNEFALSVQQWQRETFPGGDSEGAAYHLLEEAQELVREIESSEFASRIEEEAADVFLLLIAVAGLEEFNLMDVAQRKMEKNRVRVWETEKNERGYRKHIESNG